MAAPHALQVEIPMAMAVEAPVLQVGIPMVVMAASSLDPSVGEEGLHADMDTAVGVDASSLDLKRPESCRRWWQTRGRCTDYGRSSPLHRGCLTTLRSL
jgi:hypothetical protein